MFKKRTRKTHDIPCETLGCKGRGTRLVKRAADGELRMACRDCRDWQIENGWGDVGLDAPNQMI